MLGMSDYNYVTYKLDVGCFSAMKGQSGGAKFLVLSAVALHLTVVSVISGMYQAYSTLYNII